MSKSDFFVYSTFVLCLLKLFNLVISRAYLLLSDELWSGILRVALGKFSDGLYGDCTIAYSSLSFP